MNFDDERITPDEAARLDALLGADAAKQWDAFYRDRARPCPFFTASRDESLAQWVRDGPLRPGRAIDLGCGQARNAIFLARQGFAAEGVDCSPVAIEWARQRSEQAGVAVELKCGDVFDLALEAEAYDLVYDSGCFHHLPPHRRMRYVERAAAALKPGGWFGLTCFRSEGGSGLTDDEVYERRSLGGGLGYTEERLLSIWSRALRVHRIRQMAKPAAGGGLFGETFLWVLLAQK